MADVFSYSTAADSDNGDSSKGLSAGPCTCEAVDQVCYVVANRDLPVRNVATLLSYVAELVLKWCEQSDSDDSRARCA
jgi:hypothetical protein